MMDDAIELGECRSLRFCFGLPVLRALSCLRSTELDRRTFRAKRPYGSQRTRLFPQIARVEHPNAIRPGLRTALQQSSPPTRITGASTRAWLEANHPSAEDEPTAEHRHTSGQVRSQLFGQRNEEKGKGLDRSQRASLPLGQDAPLQIATPPVRELRTGGVRHRGLAARPLAHSRERAHGRRGYCTGSASRVIESRSSGSSTVHS